MMLLETDTAQVTVLPPPLLEPLHWSTVTGKALASVEEVTVHSTRMEPPPPLPEELHCVIAASVVSPSGSHCTVGAIPPPPPDPLHWSIVAGVAEAAE